MFARFSGYLPFFSPSETGFTAPELAVAKTLGFSCFGFFTSLFPRLLSPFPITSSQVDYPTRRHAETDLRKIMVPDKRRAMILVSCIRPQVRSAAHI